MLENESRSMIVAFDRERAIGSKGDIPWFGNMKEDMRNFRRLTVGTTVVMGRKTLESIGMALPKRRNIVLTRGADLSFPGVEVAGSLEEAYDLSSKDEETFILGGGQIYEQALADVNHIYTTQVDTVMEGPDAWFPEIDEEDWKVIEHTSHPSDDENIHPYSFVTYQRR